MAEPLKYDVPKPDWTVTKTADEEVQELVRLLHERGVLRLANNLLGSLPSVTKVFLEGVDNQSGANAIQNITALVEMIAHMPPEQFRRLCRGIVLALQTAGQTAERGDSEAPGLTGAMHLLRDDDLWRDLAPLLEGARSVGTALGQNINRSPHAGPHATDR